MRVHPEADSSGKDVGDQDEATKVAESAGAPSQQTMAEGKVAESSYRRIAGSKFAELIKEGSFQFIKGRYFEDCWAAQKPFEMRQDIPPEYLWSKDEVIKLWQKHGVRFMVSISYAWLSADHPDPDLFQLKRLAKLMTSFKRAHRTQQRFDVASDWPPLDEDCDCAVFLDFCSLWQRKMMDGVDTRTPEQVQQFKQGLTEINTPYGHELISSVRLEQVPEGTVRTYHLRGWTFFEMTIIDGKSPEPLLQTNIVLGDDFDIDCSEETMLELFDNHARNKAGPPISPARFNSKLQALEEIAKGKGVLLFTNGLADMELVKKKYADSYALLSTTNSLQFANAAHWSDDEFDSLVEALPDFARLEWFALGDLELTTEQARRLGKAMAQCPKIKGINMQGNDLGVAGQFAIFRQWRARLACWCCGDCCLCGECCCSGCCWCGCTPSLEVAILGLAQQRKCCKSS